MSDTPSRKSSETIELTYVTPPRSGWQRTSSTLRSWARSTFSRDSLVSSLKSLLWVVPLTVLIWIYAEREQEVTDGNVVVRIQAPANETNRVVHLVPPATVLMIHFDLKGHQKDLDEVRPWLENNTITLDIDPGLPRGEHQVDIAGQLNKLDRLKGMTVENCNPPDVRVYVDPMINREAEVRWRPQDAPGLQTPLFDPPKVTLHGPESQIASAASSGQLFAYANLKDFGSELTEAGPHHHQISLSPPPGLNEGEISFTPSRVTATIDVPNAQDSAKLTFTIYEGTPEVTPGSPLGQYQASNFDSQLRDVTVFGPKEAIEALRHVPVGPFAFFRVDVLDNPTIGARKTARLVYELPEGVHVSKEFENRTITYTLTSRKSPDQ